MNPDPWKNFCDAMDRTRKAQAECRAEIETVRQCVRKIVERTIDEHRKETQS